MTLVFLCRCGAAFPRLDQFLAHREAVHGDHLLRPARAAGLRVWHWWRLAARQERKSA